MKREYSPEYAFLMFMALVLIGFMGIIYYYHSTKLQEDLDWQHACKEAGGLPTLHLQYMSIHSEVERVCLHPSAVILLEK